MKEFVCRHGVPVGKYQGRCKKINDVNHAEYGLRALFKFVVSEGSETGKEVSRYTSTTPTDRNSCGRLLSGMIGHAIGDRETIEIDSLLVAKYELDVVETESGAVRVESATLINDAEGE